MPKETKEQRFIREHNNRDKFREGINKLRTILPNLGGQDYNITMLKVLNCSIDYIKGITGKTVPRVESPLEKPPIDKYDKVIFVHKKRRSELRIALGELNSIVPMVKYNPTKTEIVNRTAEYIEHLQATTSAQSFGIQLPHSALSEIPKTSDLDLGMKNAPPTLAQSPLNANAQTGNLGSPIYENCNDVGSQEPVRDDGVSHTNQWPYPDYEHTNMAFPHTNVSGLNQTGQNTMQEQMYPAPSTQMNMSTTAFEEKQRDCQYQERQQTGPGHAFNTNEHMMWNNQQYANFADPPTTFHTPQPFTTEEEQFYQNTRFDMDMAMGMVFDEPQDWHCNGGNQSADGNTDHQANDYPSSPFQYPGNAGESE